MEDFINFLQVNSDVLLSITGVIIARALPNRWSDLIVRLVEVVVSNKRDKKGD